MPPPSRGSAKPGAFSPIASCHVPSFRRFPRLNLTADEAPVKGWRIWGDSGAVGTVFGSAADILQIRAEGPQARGDVRLRMTGHRDEFGCRGGSRRMGDACSCTGARWLNAAADHLRSDHDRPLRNLADALARCAPLRHRHGRRRGGDTGRLASTALVAARDRADPARICDAVGHLGDRAAARRRPSGRGRRHACSSATRAAAPRCACATSWCATRRHRGRERAQGGGRLSGRLADRTASRPTGSA